MEFSQNKKGEAKSFNRWLATQIDDFTLQPEDDEVLSKLDLSIQTQTQSLAVLRQHNNSEITRYQNFKPMKLEGFTLVETWKKLPQKIIENVISLIGVKSLCHLMLTCRSFNTELDTSKIWRYMLGKDFYISKLKIEVEDVISLKQYYKFLLITGDTGILYQTNLFLQMSSSPTAIRLIQTLVDYFPIKNSNIKQLLSQAYYSEYTLSGDLKVSLDKKKNQVYLWVAGFNNVNVGKEAKWGGKITERPDGNVLRIYSFPEEKLIKNTFFLGEDLLLIEIDEKFSGYDKNTQKDSIKDTEDEKEPHQEYSKNTSKETTFYLFNLEEEVRLSSQAHIIPSGFDFKEHKQKVSIEWNNNEKLILKVKVIESCELLIFFTKDTMEPLIIIFDLKTFKQLVKSTLKLNAKISDLITPKRLLSREESQFYILDEELTVYSVSLSHSFDFVTKTLINEDNKENSDSLLEFAPSKNKNYYHGTTKVSTGKDTEREVEFLLMSKFQSFYFIDLNQWQLQQFSIQEKGIKTKVIDWNVYDATIFILTEKEILSYVLPFRQSSVNEVKRSKIMDRALGLVVTQEIFSNLCFTVLVSSYRTLKLGRDVTIEVLVGSTQKLLIGDTQSSWTLYAFKLEDIDQLTQDMIRTMINIKFEDEKLLIKTPNSCFFIDLEASKKTSIYTANRWKREIKIITYQTDDYSQEQAIPSEDLEKPTASASKSMKLVENPNRKGEEKKKWGSNNCKKHDKEEREDKRALKGKGDKFEKNVRQNGRSEKTSS